MYHVLLCNKSLGMPTLTNVYSSQQQRIYSDIVLGVLGYQKESQINKQRVVYDKWIRRMSNVTLKKKPEIRLHTHINERDSETI